ncbi:MAG: hypothetical protein NC820_02875 [Candidatus Omnitrophica bacterium]|nr:hypothetical protein [Candidatus Omnitrophota bacterium]
MRGYKVSKFTIPIFTLFFFFTAFLVYSQSLSPNKVGEEEALPDYSLPQVIPTKMQGVNFFSATIRIILSLIIVILCIYLTIYFLKKISLPQRVEGKVSFGNIFILDTLYLAPHRVIYLIYAGKNILVVASSDKGLCLLDKIDDPSLISDILNKKKEQWEKAKPFGVYLRGMQKKEYIRGYLARYFKSLKSLCGIKHD